MTEPLLLQAEWCRKLGSPLYAHLLTRCADDCEQGGPLHDLLRPHEQDPRRSLLPLRLMGAVHRLVLQGQALELARYYPSAGGSVDLDRAWLAFRETVARDRAALAELLPHPVQTNDAGRSGSLLGGFLLIARLTRLPLRLLEIGSSAGLNLCWDRYRYEWPAGAWGDPAAALRIENVFVNEPPAFPPQVQVASRAGCDLDPLDLRDPEGRLTLRAFTWADQVERLQRLQQAIGIALETPYTLEAAGAADWLERQLAQSVPGTATVVFHSTVWMYLPPSEQERVTSLIQQAGARATAAAPLAWLRLESSGGEPELRLRIDPAFPDQLIATSGFHAPAVRWVCTV